ncbi:MAG: CHAT domain-containing protein [Pyrinomonadaceae bacterium]
MATAVPARIEIKMRIVKRQFRPAFSTKRLLTVCLMLMTVETAFTIAQPSSLDRIERHFNNGHFTQVVDSILIEIARSRRAGDHATAANAGILASRALMQLERYDAVPKLLDEAMSDALQAENARSGAAVYFARAALMRTRRDFRAAADLAGKGLAAAPNDRQVELEYHLAIGRVLYSSGYDIAAIVWLEKAERMLHAFPRSALQLEVMRLLSQAWWSKFDYSKALTYAKRVTEISEKSEFRYKYRLSLYDHAMLLNATGQKRMSHSLLEKGLGLTFAAKDDYQSCLFLSSLLLSSLYEGNIVSARKQLDELEQRDAEKRFAFEALLGRAVVASFEGRNALSDEYFNRLGRLKNHSDYMAPYWKATIAERTKNWEGLLAQSIVLRDLYERDNFLENLPGIYLGFAKAHWGMGRREPALENARRSASMINNVRRTNDVSLSLGMLETYHSVYRLLAELESALDGADGARKSFELADYLKAMVLRDRIENSAVRPRPELSPDIRRRAEDLSRKFLLGIDTGSELAKLERTTSDAMPDSSVHIPDLRQLDTLEDLSRTAIASYLFTTSGELRAYVWEKGKGTRTVNLQVSELDAQMMAASARKRIRDLVFFKKDGKEIYDKLLAPLSLTAEHLIIIPDKSLWKIPFHALSHDGASYLIEKTLVTYAPSAAMLNAVLTKKVPTRETIQVFANDSHQGRYLLHVNKEAEKVAAMMGVRPFLGSPPTEFLKNSDRSDILHFSMHAQADAEEPLSSFLGFKSSNTNDGRVSVEDLLKVRLKPGNLAFVASCDTNNVLNGEGVVSIPWAMLGSGSTTVISAQWEANDRSAGVFVEKFYKAYRKEQSAAKALQSAALAMIGDKSGGFHEPYYWATFNLLGDFR